MPKCKRCGFLDDLNNENLCSPCVQILEEYNINYVYVLSESLQWDNERVISIHQTLDGAKSYLPATKWESQVAGCNWMWKGYQTANYTRVRDLFITRQNLNP